MTGMTQPILPEQPTHPVDDTQACVGEQAYRANAYGLLAALLRAEPGGDALGLAARFADAGEGGDELAIAMALLGLASRNTGPAGAANEFFQLFIGLGRGELVPYGSWYQTGFLMERPLGELRDDLRGLGFERSEGVNEPEDHVAALCEVMSQLIADGEPIATQLRFFSTHMEPWLERFFTDLEGADNAVFYGAVGRFGAAFVDFERRYLAMPA